MAKGKGFLDTVLNGVRMNEDDFYENGEEFENEGGEEEDDEGGFIDSERESRPRFPFSFGSKKESSSTRRKKYDDRKYDDRYDEEPEEEEESYEADPEDSYDPVDDLRYDEPAPKPARSSGFGSTRSQSTRKASVKVTPMRRTHAGQNVAKEVRILHPLDMEQASAIGEALLDECVVVLNLEGLDLDLAQRIVDFASGCIFALGANLHKVTEYFFVIAPSSVEISGDMKSIMRGASPSVRAEY